MIYRVAMLSALLLVGTRFTIARGQELKQEPPDCLKATAKTNGPCKLTKPNGDFLATLADGSTWITIHPDGEPFAIRIAPNTWRTSPPEIHTFIAENLPESDIIGAPESTKIEIDGDCQAKTYAIFSEFEFSGKMGTGGILGIHNFEPVLRNVMPGTPMDKLFEIGCKSQLALRITPGR
jgi:hypothetical protein